MNRLYQVAQTLRKNLEDNREDREEIEFILVDFDSIDGLSRWVMKNFEDDLRSGYLKLYFTSSLVGKWHASIAKNTAHRLATGSILVNLDCDNFTGLRGGRYVIDLFDHHKHVYLHQCAGFESGTGGRISTRRENFFEVGGYDESFEPMGYQDTDLLARFSKKGFRRIKNTDLSYSKAIINSKDDSMENCGKGDWSEMNWRNLQRSVSNISSGRLVANVGKEIGIPESQIIRLMPESPIEDFPIFRGTDPPVREIGP